LPYIPPPQKTGIPLLDQEKKSLPCELLSSLYTDIGDLFANDAKIRVRALPAALLEAVGENVVRSMLRATRAIPIHARSYKDSKRARPVARIRSLVRGAVAPYKPPGSIGWAFPLLLGFALWSRVAASVAAPVRVGSTIAERPPS